MKGYPEVKAKAAVLTRFNEPLELQEFEVGPLGEGEVLVKITAAGVCGSDVHMWHAKDPRTPLPIILGHEGVGEIAQIGGRKADVFGRELKPGDKVMWERGIMCGKCYYCVVKKQPSLCPSRKTYGISLSCKESPHLRGCYAEYLHLLPNAHMIRIDDDIDPAVLVPASCSGATGAHAVELADVAPGDNVVIIGPGPVGLYILAMVLERGAAKVIVLGTDADAMRLQWCREFGAQETISVSQTTLEQRVDRVRELTNGLGANVVFECTGVRAAAEEGLHYVAPYGTYLIPGIATPVGESTIRFFEQIARKNVRLQGVWVSDTGHLYRAIQLVLSRRYPFEKVITHRFGLEEATKALETVAAREAMKAVLVPSP